MNGTLTRLPRARMHGVVQAMALILVGGYALAALAGCTRQLPPIALPAIVELDFGKPVTLAEQLRIELVDVKDSRCPKDARCIWAGHAAATLKVKKAGLAEAAIVIGSAAPAGMQLPFEAVYAGYRFTLVDLTPAAPQPATVGKQQATVRISVP